MTYIIKNPNEAQRILCEQWKAEGYEVEEIIENEIDEYIAPTKEELIADFRDSLRDMRLHLKGKLKLKTLDEVIDEIRHSTPAAL